MYYLNEDTDYTFCYVPTYIRRAIRLEKSTIEGVGWLHFKGYIKCGITMAKY